MPLTFTRIAAVVAAGAALTVGAAGTASAATTSHLVEDHTVSATFKIGVFDLSAPVDGCVAVVAERAEANGIADRIKNIVNLGNITSTLAGENTTILRTATGSPVAFPVLGVPVTMAASDIPSGVHSLITYCATDTVPVMKNVVVGDAQNTMGSVVSGGPALISSGINMF